MGFPEKMRFFFHSLTFLPDTSLCRVTRSDAGGDAGCPHVLFGLHLQQQQHSVHHGHLDSHQATGHRERAHYCGQVRLHPLLSIKFFANTSELWCPSCCHRLPCPESGFCASLPSASAGSPSSRQLRAASCLITSSLCRATWLHPLLQSSSWLCL